MPELLSVAAALKGWAHRGRPVEIPFRQMADLVTPHTGQLAIMAGGSGAGKSTVAANWAYKTSQPCLYIAQDDPHETIKVLGALATGQDTHALEVDRDYWSDRVARKLGERGLFVSRGRHSIEDIRVTIMAYTEWLMEPPHIVFIDNLYNMRSESGYTENTFYSEMLPAFQEMAIEEDVLICLMHHTGRSGDHGKKIGQGTEPMRLTDLLHGGEREAAHVWGVYHTTDTRHMFIQILKQRGGRADPSGYLKIMLDWQPEKGQLYSR